ncbi:cation:proton antiporter [Lentzea flaviverrucosa]|uniref:cation:proton antiporter domain-containing protein n=1 Tax=Lentzea flaviverrucosa TaxID=200379 RepID=UPI000A6EC18C|nr:cation:proton antiporter [Lentzea flaviverrucosa]
MRFLVAIAVVIIVCHALAWVFGKLGQPPVVGEILGGLLLGPTGLTLLWPAGSAWLLTPSVMATLSAVAQLGLVTFMFLLGSELQVVKGATGTRVLAAVVAGSLVLPFAGGVVLAVMGRSVIAGPAAHPVTYTLVFGLAMSITALPVLARILVDEGMQEGRVGQVALACAAIGDGAAWMALTVILTLSGLVGSGGLGLTIGMVAALTLTTFLLVRPALARLVERAPAGAMLGPVLVAGALAYAATTQLIGLHAAVGAFLFGTALPRGAEVVMTVRKQLHGFTQVVLLPLFFAGVGLSTAISAVGGSLRNWLLLVAVVLVATITKFVGAGGAAYLAGMSARHSLQLGALMNCRGVTELVIATICLQYEIVNSSGFTILVLMALTTTALTGPLVRSCRTGRMGLVVHRRMAPKTKP